MIIYSFPENLLLAKLTGKNVSEATFLNFNSLSSEIQKEFLRQKKLLSDGYPLDYILGKIEFLGLKLQLNSTVLIPREETEYCIKSIFTGLLDQNSKIKVKYGQHLFNKSLRFSGFNKYSKQSVIMVDMGCGSGAIGLSLAKIFYKSVLCDISLKALQLAKKNAKANKIKNCEFIKSDLFESQKLRHLIRQSNDWMLFANLPYLPVNDIKQAEKNKINFEPKLALYSGFDGLSLFSKILCQLKFYKLCPKTAFFELDPRNVFKAQQLSKNYFSHSKILSDQNNLPRLLICTI